MRHVRPKPKCRPTCFRPTWAKPIHAQLQATTAPRSSAASGDQAGYEKTLQRVSGLLAPTHTVLELGCGTGTTALRLAPHARSLLATDASPEMVAIARERLHAQPTPGLTFAVADADPEGERRLSRDRHPWIW